MIITGLLDYAAYGPQFDQALPREVGWLRLPPFDWPTRPSWLFRVTQGLHVTLGIILIPVVLAKLWSVIPKLFVWPPARSLAQVLERLSLLLLVGGILFEIATGLLNIQYAYLFGFDFYTAHYFGAWVFIAAFVAHVTLKLPRMVSALRSRPALRDRRRPGQIEPLRAELRTPLAATRPEPPDPDDLVATAPGRADDEPTRRDSPGRWRVPAARRPHDRADPRRCAGAAPPCCCPADVSPAPDRTASRSTAPPPRQASNRTRPGNGGG